MRALLNKSPLLTIISKYLTNIVAVSQQHANLCFLFTIEKLQTHKIL